MLAKCPTLVFLPGEDQTQFLERKARGGSPRPRRAICAADKASVLLVTKSRDTLGTLHLFLQVPVIPFIITAMERERET